MTDETIRPPEHAEPVADAAAPDAPAGETAGGAGADEPAEPRAGEAREWLAQLQHMIDRIAGEAAPVARDVAAKAAELAAVAGDKAGPLARRAAEVTEDVGTRVAARSRQLADDLRHRGAESGEAPPDAEPAAPAAPEPATTEEEPPAS